MSAFPSRVDRPVPAQGYAAAGPSDPRVSSHELAPPLGEDDANALMSEFPASEADELVTKQFLRAELAVTRGELRSEMADLRTGLRMEMAALENRLLLRMGAALGASTAILATLITVQ